MARFFSYIASILAFQALSDASSLPIPQDQPREALAAQQRKVSCPAPDKVVKNGGFETGHLSPWGRYIDNPYPPYITCKIVNTGYQSRYSAEVSGYNGPDDFGIMGGLGQQITICENVIYSLTFSLYQVPKGTNYDPVNEDKPSMAVYLLPPMGESPHVLGNFNFNKAGYSYNVGQGPNGSHEAGRWATFTAAFPYAQPGNWTVYFKHVIKTSHKAKRNATLSVRFDNVSAQPLHS